MIVGMEKEKCGKILKSMEIILDKCDADPCIFVLFAFDETLAGNDSYSKIWKVIKMLLVVSHGQASVERGF